jgi:hypothetical protein
MYAKQYRDDDRSALELTLSRAGEYWSAAYAGRVFHLQHSKGLADLAQLIARPGQELHVLELISEQKSERVTHTALAASAQEGLRVSGRGRWDAPLDTRARTAYRARYEDLAEQLEEAQGRNDHGHVQRLNAELAQLVGQLQQRLRVPCPATERARKAVYNRLRAVLARIAACDQELSMHLEVTVKTGIFCSYRPELVRFVRAC